VPGPSSVKNSARPKAFAFLLLPRFAMLAFSAAVEPLRAANLLSGRELYTWRILSADGRPAVCSNGAMVSAEGGPTDDAPYDTIVVCGGVDAHRFQDAATLAWLRASARRGAQVGAISDGSFVLARAGLLEGRRCTIHWNCLDAFMETFPDLDVKRELYEIDRNRFTCSGGTASLDLMLGMIENDHGHGLAVQVADQFLHDRIRANDDRQRLSLRVRVGAAHPKLLEAVQLMEDNLEEPLSRMELARRIGVSSRQLERLFQKYLGMTPSGYYVELRLLRAHMLLSHSSLSVMEVGLACGFVSASHFTKRYRERFNRTPRLTRMGDAAGRRPSSTA
jgi:transcriptional regulator GlxA family with amidase domain